MQSKYFLFHCLLSQWGRDNLRQNYHLEGLKSSPSPDQIHGPYTTQNGKKDEIQILLLSEVAAKDDFFNIKKSSCGDLVSAHRVPPQMMAIMIMRRSYL
ncbi:hypothetical protein ACMV8I_03230 [Ewingella sp. S1.OA.A_B6]